MEPTYFAVRKAVCAVLIIFQPAAGDCSWVGWSLFGMSALISSVHALRLLAYAPVAAFCGGLGLAAFAAVAAAARADLKARGEIRERVAAATVHNNSEEGPEGPRRLLPQLLSDVLVVIANMLHSDR